MPFRPAVASMSVAALLAAASAALAPEQARPDAVSSTGTAAITGTVVDGATGAPIPGAVVHLGLRGRGTAGSASRQVTDSRGRFAFLDAPASDQVSLSAGKPGYLDGGYSAGDLPGTTDQLLSVADGEWVSGIRIELWRPGAIAGEVLDERGEPVADVIVRLLAVVRIAGHDRIAAGPFTTTDDRGRYRLSGLAPGRYVVSVPSLQAAVPPPADGRVFAYPITFHPGVPTIAAASPIELGPGQSRLQTDIRLTPHTAVGISGRVQGLAAPIADVTLRLLQQGLESLGLGSEVATARVAPDGAFSFAGIPAGAYTIESAASVSELHVSANGLLLAPRLPNAPGMTGVMSRINPAPAGPPGTRFRISHLSDSRTPEGRLAVAVGDTDVTGLVVPLRPGAVINGHVRLEVDPARPVTNLRGVILMAEPASGDPWLGQPEGRTNATDPLLPFTISGLRQGGYLLRTIFNLGILVKSVTYQGRDYTYTPLDASTTPVFDDVLVTVTTARATVTGVVRDDRGNAAPGVRVVAFPADPRRWANYGIAPPDIRSATTSNTGSYVITSLPGGDYNVVATPFAQGRWQDDGFFARAAPRATRVRLDWGATLTQDLTVGRR